MTLRVVVADRSPDSRRATIGALGGVPGKIVEAATGAEAIEFCRAERTNLLLLSLDMPDMDGYQILEELMADGIITIVTSSREAPANKKKATGLGAKLFLNKPLSSTQGAVIIEHLQRLQRRKKKARPAKQARPDVQTNKTTTTTKKTAPEDAPQQRTSIKPSTTAAPGGTPAEEFGPESAEQLDALGEIANIATGQAVAALVDLLDVFVLMSTPSVGLFGDFANTSNEATEFVVVRQPFMGELSGDAVLMYTWDSDEELARLIEPDNPHVTTLELLTEISAILSGAFIGVIGRQLSVRLRYGSPDYVGANLSIKDLGLEANLDANSLTVALNIMFEETSVSVCLILVVADESRAAALKAVDRLLHDV